MIVRDVGEVTANQFLWGGLIKIKLDSGSGSCQLREYARDHSIEHAHIVSFIVCELYPNKTVV